MIPTVNMVLKIQHWLELPAHTSGGFDHGDIFERNGFSFVAHTANGTVEMYDGKNEIHLKTIQGVPQASGVVCAQAEGIAFAASRGTGEILALDGSTGNTINVSHVGERPNGLAWDSRRHKLLVADVADFKLRVLDSRTWNITTEQLVPGRPRWCKYSSSLDRFIVNIHTPSQVAILSPEDVEIESLIPISVEGAHGLDVDEENAVALVACDGGAVVAVDLQRRRETWKVGILPNPDVAWLNVESRLLYCANSKPGLIQVLDLEKRKIEEEVSTEEGCHTIAFHQEAQKLHAYLPKSCRVSFYRELST